MNTVKDKIHICFGIRDTGQEKENIHEHLMMQIFQKMWILLLLILYLLFLVHIMILLRLANTMVEPRRLNSAISWTEIISILKPNKWVQYKSTQIMKAIYLHIQFLHHSLNHPAKS